jgi:hypothetical protein
MDKYKGVDSDGEPIEGKENRIKEDSDESDESDDEERANLKSELE